MTDELRAAANRKAREEKKQALLRAMLVRYVADFRGFQSADPHSVAPRVHDAMDAVLRRDRSKDRSSREIKCGKGCDHCCKVPVEVFPQEAALLIAAARQAGIRLDTDRLHRQSRHVIESWREQNPADRACVFLGSDGACRVYESRPNACRKLLVVTEPALCDASKHAADCVGRWISWEAEILGAAALEEFGAALMPKALLAALQANESPQGSRQNE
jgi:Fe-S-cluster containining protein